MDSLDTRHGRVLLPAFFPDATYGALRATGFEDAEQAGLMGLVMNAYHLYTRPGASVIKRMGGPRLAGGTAPCSRIRGPALLPHPGEPGVQEIRTTDLFARPTTARR